MLPSKILYTSSYFLIAQVRDSLSKTLNCKVLETLGRIEDNADQQTDNSGRKSVQTGLSIFL
jgi:hypothetical protein